MATCKHCSEEIRKLRVEVINRKFGEYDIELEELDLDTDYPFNSEVETVYYCPNCETEAYDPDQIIDEEADDD